MGARTKKRAKFDFRGRSFVWRQDEYLHLRIASIDKKFVVAYAYAGMGLDDPAVLIVLGQEFPGISAKEARPIYLVVPEFEIESMGALVGEVLQWSFDTDKELHRVAKPPRLVWHSD